MGVRCADTIVISTSTSNFFKMVAAASIIFKSLSLPMMMLTIGGIVEILKQRNTFFCYPLDPVRDLAKNYQVLLRRHALGRGYVTYWFLGRADSYCQYYYFYICFFFKKR